MKWLDRIFMRRREHPWRDAVRTRSRPRLVHACRQLTESERTVQERMGLCIRPRLALVDEELASMISPRLREEIELKHRTSAKAG